MRSATGWAILAHSVFVGVLPFVSLRNAEVLNNEFPGMRIPEEIMSQLRSTPPEQVSSVGLRLAQQVAEAALRCFSGYIIAPFNRLDVASPLVRLAAGSVDDSQ